MAATAVCISCQKAVVDDAVADELTEDGSRSRTVTFRIGGGFESATRAVPVGDSDMTDLWIVDYEGSEEKSLTRQQSGQSGFGSVTMRLPYGRHTICFVASRGTGAEDDGDGTLVWAVPGDTFWKAISLDVSAGTSGTVDVTLRRVATCLNVVVDDVLPAGMTRLAVTPAQWYYGIRYLTGEPCHAESGRERSVSIPSSYIGTSGVSASFYGLSDIMEWHTDFTVTAYGGDDAVIGQAAVSDAPFLCNRVTRYTGRLFSLGADFNVSLEDGWDERYDGTW